jgi:hypothetical protein
MINPRFNESKNRRKISARQSCFTPCKRKILLLEPLKDAAENAAQCATILLSPALASFDGFQNARNSGEKIYIRMKSISWGYRRIGPNMNGQMTAQSTWPINSSGNDEFSLRAFLREKHVANHSITSTSLQKGRHQRQTR